MDSIASRRGGMRRRLIAISIVILFVSNLWFDGVFQPAHAQNPTVLVTGSNRGIGLEFVKQYAAEGWFVIATTRRPFQADQLQQLARNNNNITIEKLDVTSDEHLKTLAEKYKQRPIDVLINNAGVSGDFRGPGQHFGSLDYTTVATFMSVNVVGPIRVAEAFYENVKMSRQKKIIAITALLLILIFTSPRKYFLAHLRYLKIYHRKYMKEMEGIHLKVQKLKKF